MERLPQLGVLAHAVAVAADVDESSRRLSHDQGREFSQLRQVRWFGQLRGVRERVTVQAN